MIKIYKCKLKYLIIFIFFKKLNIGLQKTNLFVFICRIFCMKVISLENNELFEKIHKYKIYRDKVLLQELIEQFNPLLKKYSCKSEFEDMLQDLTVFFIQLLDKIPLNELKEDKYILSYISKSVKNKHINLINISIKKNSYLEYFDFIDIKKNVNDEFDIIDTFDLLSKLNKREFLIIHSLFFKEMSANEIAKSLNISRQAVNQIKLKSLNKLKKELA